MLNWQRFTNSQQRCGSVRSTELPDMPREIPSVCKIVDSAVPHSVPPTFLATATGDDVTAATTTTTTTTATTAAVILNFNTNSLHDENYIPDAFVANYAHFGETSASVASSCMATNTTTKCELETHEDALKSIEDASIAAAAVAVAAAAAGVIMIKINDSAAKLSETTTAKSKRKCLLQLPKFVLLISLLEIFVFVYDYYVTTKSSRHGSGTFAAVPSDSVLIYRPDRRLQIWRYVSYMLLHANWFHLSFNVVTQLLFGVPLEAMHGPARVAVIYFAGVCAASLGTSVVDSAAYLVGASGGVYALLTAQLANVLINFEQIRFSMMHFTSLLVFVGCDFAYAVYSKYIDVEPIRTLPSVSYIAHLTGSMAGLALGILILKNFHNNPKPNLIWWVALTICVSFTIFTIAFNLINTIAAQRLEEQGEEMRKNFFHNFGVK